MYDKDLQDFIVMSVAFLLEHNYLTLTRLTFWNGGHPWGPNFHLLWQTCTWGGGIKNLFSLAPTPVQASLNGMVGTLMT